jgi:hypothetical protein
MAKQTGGVIVATFRDKLRGAIKGHQWVPAWMIDDWFMDHVAGVLAQEYDEPTDPHSVELLLAVTATDDGRAAIAAIEKFLEPSA